MSEGSKDNPPAIDWPGLLKWSLQYSDGTSSTTRMSSEDVEFLKKAIQHALSMCEDPCKVVTAAAVKADESFTANDIPGALTALSVIENSMEHDSVCRNLHKLGAVEVLLRAMWNSNYSVVQLSLAILSYTTANNPDLQRAVYQRGGLSELVNRTDSLLCEMKTELSKQRNLSDDVDGPHADRAVCAKLSVGCVAQLIRHLPQLEKEFVDDKRGLVLLTTALSIPDRGLQQKAASLVRHLAVEGVVSDAHLTESNLLECVDSLFSQRDISWTDIQAGELIAAMVDAVVHTHPLLLERREHLALRERLMKAVLDRYDYLTALPSTATDDETVTLSHVEVERNSLTKILTSLA